MLGYRIERGGRLIKDDKRRILIERAGQRDLLRLAAGNLHAVLLKILVKRSVQSLEHFFHPLGKACLIDASPHLIFLIIERSRNILSQREGKHAEILKDDGEKRLIFLIVIFFDIDPV